MSKRWRGVKAAAFLVFPLLFASCLENGKLAVSNPTTPNPTTPILDTDDCTIPKVTLSHSASSGATTSNFEVLNLANFPNARCNDGSAATYRVRLGSGIARNRWIIVLEGGGECTNQAECQARASAQGGRRVSSLPYQQDNSLAVMGTFGLFSTSPTDNPDFYDASVLRIFYCSSDWWTGNKPGQGTAVANNVATWHFRGKEIIRSVIQDAKNKYGLDQAQEVLLAGGSAGGVGVLFNTHYVRDMFPSSVRFLAFADAGFNTNEPQFDPATGMASNPPTYPNAERAAEAALLWNAQADTQCAQEAAKPGATLICLSPFDILTQNPILVPVFVQQSLTDKNFLYKVGAYDLAADQPLPNSSAYIDVFRESVRQKIALVHSRHTVYAADNFEHGILNSGRFTSTQNTFSSLAVPTTVQQQLGEWYSDPCKSKKLIQ